MSSTDLPEPTANTRQQQKQQTRLKLIHTTMACIAELGFADTTVAKVAERAGLSQGIINFHFKGKEQMLLATLQHLVEEYRNNWQQALDSAGDDPQTQLDTLVTALLSPPICTMENLAVWFAFWGQSSARKDYLQICGEADRALLQEIRSRYKTLNRDDAAAVASGLYSMVSGLWLRMLLQGDSFTPQQSLATYRATGLS